MPQITLTFPSTVELNVSCQVGDTAYFSPTTSIAGFATSAQSTVVEIGRVISISKASGVWVLICDTNLINGQQPTTSDFISFSKNNCVNLSSILGYYAETKLINTSYIKSELYSIGCDYFESSK
tara:strand:- start:394 stop:765 length:372 start_codon:yes stop_codon:yes gene_type:complete